MHVIGEAVTFPSTSAHEDYLHCTGTNGKTTTPRSLVSCPVHPFHVTSHNSAFAPLGRFGGVLLGPARFTHIHNAARQLLEAQGFIQRGCKAPGARRKAGR